MAGWLLGYGLGGGTTVNGVSNNNSQSNLGWGIGLGIPINHAIGLKFGYTGTRTQNQLG